MIFFKKIKDYFSMKKQVKEYKNYLVIHSLNTVLLAENILTSINEYIEKYNDTVVDYVKNNKDDLSSISQILNKIVDSPELTTEFYKNIIENAKNEK